METVRDRLCTERPCFQAPKPPHRHPALDRVHTQPPDTLRSRVLPQLMACRLQRDFGCQAATDSPSNDPKRRRRNSPTTSCPDLTSRGAAFRPGNLAASRLCALDRRASVDCGDEAFLFWGIPWSVYTIIGECDLGGAPAERLSTLQCRGCLSQPQSGDQPTRSATLRGGCSFTLDRVAACILYKQCYWLGTFAITHRPSADDISRLPPCGWIGHILAYM